MKVRFTLVGAAISAAMAVAGCGAGPDSGSDGTDLVVATSTAPSYVPMYLADKVGYLDDAGIDLDMVPMERGAGPIIAALSNGSVDVAVQGPAVLAAANEAGSDLRFFCGIASRMTSVILAKPDSGIVEATAENWQSTVRSWKGKTIGVPALEGTVTHTVLSLVEEAGLTANDVKLVAVGVGEGAFQTLQSGQVDLLFSYPFFTQQWADRASVVFDWFQDGPKELSNVMQAGWVARKDWLDQNPELATGFCDSMDRGVNGVFREREVAEDILADKFGLSGKPLDAAMAKDGPMGSQSTELNCQAITAALTASGEAGLLKKQHSCEDVVWKADQ